MKAVVLSLIIFTCIIGGAFIGIFLRAMLPARHLTDESRNMVTLGMGIVATMAALAVGLMIQGAQTSFSALRSDLIDMSAKIVFLDKLLADYGPEAEGARETLRGSLERTINQLWPNDGSGGAMIEPPESKSETLYYQILSLKPDNDARHAIHDEAVSLTYDLALARDSLVMGQSRSIPGVFLIVLGIILYCARNNPLLVRLHILQLRALRPDERNGRCDAHNSRAGGHACALYDNGAQQALRRTAAHAERAARGSSAAYREIKQGRVQAASSYFAVFPFPENTSSRSSVP
ncbi:MAG: hypothetical protein ACREOP_04420, partial [Thermodesulfobacteriota bacterium]